MRPAANWPTKTRQPLRKFLNILICTLIGLSALAQEPSSNLNLLSEFELPRTEEVEFFKNTSTGSPILLSTKGDIIFIRPINMETGLPIRLLSIRSNDTKKIRRHELRGDSLYCLVKSVEEGQPDGFESVIYSLRGDVLSEAHRHDVRFSESPSTKTAQTIHFTASANGKFGLIVRQEGFAKNKRASVFLEITRHPEGTVETHLVQLPFDSDDIEITGVSITNRGIVNIGAQTGVKINSPFLRKHIIYCFSPEQNELHEFDMSLDKVYLKDLVIQIHSSQTSAIALYSRDPFKQAETDGFVYMTIDTSGTKVLKKSIVEFKDDIIYELQGPDSRKTEHVEHLFATDLLELNGELIALLDQQYLDQVCTTDPRTGIITCTDQYHFDGILLQSVSNQNSNTIIGRRQIDDKTKGPYMGQQAYISNGTLTIFYNDHVRNESLEAERIMNNPSRSALRYVSTTDNEILRTGALASDDFVHFTACPGFEDKGTISLVFSDGKNYKIGIIRANEL